MLTLIVLPWVAAAWSRLPPKPADQFFVLFITFEFIFTKKLLSMKVFI